MMYDLGVLKDEDLDYIARASGIEEKFREGWKQMIRGYRVRPLLTKIESIATSAYEDGYIGTAEYQKLLKEAGFSDVVINWVMKVGQLQRRFSLMKMSIDTIVLKFRKGVIDKNTAMRQLTSLGLDTDTALHHLAKAEVQAMRASDKAKEKAPKLTVAQLIAAWKAGVIETEDVVDALLAKGYTEQEARILIETELAKAAAAPA
jgi:wyosine [tRNA(Phe)-imidazoG37] synthetase (radical SAM superfamily)